MFVDSEREGERQMAIHLDFIVELVLSDEGFVNHTIRDHT
jgi:hypothetical protein